MKEEFMKTAENLISEAKEAAQKAYAPYSKFRVGAAVALSSPSPPALNLSQHQGLFQ